MKAKDIVKLLILLAEIIDILSKQVSVKGGKNPEEIARKFGVSFHQLWKRIQGKEK